MTHPDPEPGFLEPAYGQRSLSDVLPAVAVALGRAQATDEAVGLHLPEAPSYVVFLVDGLGSDLLAAHAHAAPYLSGLLGAEATGTAGVPSTTATSLTSLGTGLAPGGHGVVGFTSRVPGSDRLLNALFWDKDVDPLQWQPHRTRFQTLEAAGVVVTTVNKREFRSSGLTVAAHRGGDYVGADRAGERIAGAVAAAQARPSLTYLYDGDLDWTGHRYGVASAQWLQQLAIIDAEAEQLRDALPSYTRLARDRRPRHGRLPAAPPRRRRRRPRLPRRASCCSEARRGSAMSTARPVRSTTSPRAGAGCSATGRWC